MIFEHSSIQTNPNFYASREGFGLVFIMIISAKPIEMLPKM